MKILGIDYGRSKVGLAVGDTGTRTAEPLRVSSRSKIKYQISKILKDDSIEKIVVGLPGGKMDEEIKKFGEKLRKETGVSVEYIDETLTTQDAQRLLIESGGNRKKRKEREDAVAAALMLQSCMEARLR